MDTGKGTLAICGLKMVSKTYSYTGPADQVLSAVSKVKGETDALTVVVPERVEVITATASPLISVVESKRLPEKKTPPNYVWYFSGCNYIDKAGSLENRRIFRFRNER